MILTLLLTTLIASINPMAVSDTTKTLDLTGTVVVNADYANQSVESIKKSDVSVVDTVDTHDEFVKILLFGDKTWRYIKLDGYTQKPEIFKMHWETTSVNPYQKKEEQLPDAWSVWLVDSLNQFHCPFKGAVGPNGKYGPRNNRAHQGVDLPLTLGTPIYAAFSGQVRVSRFSDRGYGNLVIIRHENGLETFYAHLSERKVEVGDWVNAGQVIGLGGSTGRSTGPHLHVEVRYQGFSFDPEWIIDFRKGQLRQRLFVLKKKYFGVNHANAQDFEAEADKPKTETKPAESKPAETKPAETKPAGTTTKTAATETAAKPADKPAPKPSTTTTDAEGRVWHVVVEGDTVYALASRHRTTVAKICELNNLTDETFIRIGQKLRIK